MKKPIYIFGLVLALGLGACSGSADKTKEGEGTEQEVVEEEKAEPTIVGDWKLSDMDMGVEIPKGQEKMFEDMINEMRENSTISFKEDGTFAQQDKMGKDFKKESGTYTVEGDVLKTKNSAGVESSLNITSLTEDEVSFSIEDNGTQMSMTYTRK